MISKAWIRRRGNDPSPRVRHAVQTAFLVLNIWIGAQFYFFVRYFETGGWKIERPPGVEGWLPIAGMMNASFLLQTGRVPEIHPAAMILFLTFLAISIAFRKAFCGWLCPIGTISEWIWRYGQRTFRVSLLPPRWLDVALRGLKYTLLGLFVWAVAAMPAESIEAFLSSPYGLVADVKMLNFFRALTPVAAAVIGFLILGSFFVPNLWCRYLCPYGALMGIAALASPLRIRRVEASCIDCGKCAKACPAALPVDTLVQIRSAECTACLECVAVCPSEGALFLSTPKPRRVSPYVVGAALVFLFVGSVSLAKLSGHWHSPIPEAVLHQLIPAASHLSHP